MDALDILLHPQLAGRKSDPVKDFNDELRSFIGLMFFTMNARAGVGLAAPQVNWFKRLAVIHVPGEDPVAMANPKIVETEGKMFVREGCLSIPGRTFQARVERFSRVTVEYQDAFGEKKALAECEGVLAQAIQHEVDHLDGKFYIDHLSRFQRNMIINKLAKKIKAREREMEREQEHEKQEQKLQSVRAARAESRAEVAQPAILDAPGRPVTRVELTDSE